MRLTSFGITFDGKHSYRDFSLRVIDKHIGNPSKIKLKERVPFSNKIYDFSGIYGGQEYEERSLTYIFQIKDYQKVDLAIKKAEVLNWLMQPNQQMQLFDDFIPGFYFLAEVEQAPDFEELKYSGRLTVDFTAYPFKVGELYEGNDIWDTFNFLLDYAQITEFEVSGARTVTLYNSGVSVAMPAIVASAPMQLVKDGVTFNVPAGKSQSHDFLLDDMENRISITGNGRIQFLFRKELI